VCSGDTDYGRGTPLVEHWDGTTWGVVPTPSPLRPGQELGAVAGSSSSDVWAVGSDNSGGSGGALILHWNGSVWSSVRAPLDIGALGSVAVLSATDAWAAGVNVA